MILRFRFRGTFEIKKIQQKKRLLFRNRLLNGVKKYFIYSIPN